MIGKILRHPNNLPEIFIADSGTTICLIPEQIAIRNRVKIIECDEDESGVENASGQNMTSIGQTAFFVKFETIKNPKLIRALWCAES